MKPNHLFGDGINPGAIQIAIDWDPTALHLRYQSLRERVSISTMKMYFNELVGFERRFIVIFSFNLVVDRTRVGDNLQETTNGTG